MTTRYAPFVLALTLTISLAGCRRISNALSSGATVAQSAGTHAADAVATSPLADADQDGVPDGAEIHSFSDRSNFRRWMATIAEGQFYQISDEWTPEQRDCAGLVRFAIREALRRHDRLWFQKMGPGYENIAPDVSALQLGAGPLGAKLFRTDYGSFSPEDIAAGRFSEFADARSLKNFNCEFISRERRRALAGDLLFFHQPWVQKYPYHVMIFLGETNSNNRSAGDWVVYHTGSSPDGQGTIKKVRMSVLDKHPDKHWRPVESNPNYLGVFRLKMLE